MRPRALTIAGSDSGGGAGIQADLKTFTALKVFGTTAITAVTVQNTLGVRGYQLIEPETVSAQIEAVLDDIGTDAVKSGMLGTAEIIAAVARTLRHRRLLYVLDPVMIAKGGAKLLAPDAIQNLKDLLIPIATVVTPNIPEAEEISGIKIDSEEARILAANKILSIGPKAVIIKGGHGKSEQGSHAFDDLILINESDAVKQFYLPTERIDTRCDHGTGCTFSAALTAYLAKGEDIYSAAKLAKAYLSAALKAALPNGHGHCSVDHMHAIS